MQQEEEKLITSYKISIFTTSKLVAHFVLLLNLLANDSRLPSHLGSNTSYAETRGLLFIPEWHAMCNVSYHVWYSDKETSFKAKTRQELMHNDDHSHLDLGST